MAHAPRHWFWQILTGQWGPGRWWRHVRVQQLCWIDCRRWTQTFDQKQPSRKRRGRNLPQTRRTILCANAKVQCEMRQSYARQQRLRSRVYVGGMQLVRNSLFEEWVAVYWHGGRICRSVAWGLRIVRLCESVSGFRSIDLSMYVCIFLSIYPSIYITTSYCYCLQNRCWFILGTYMCACLCKHVTHFHTSYTHTGTVESVILYFKKPLQTLWYA